MLARKEKLENTIEAIKADEEKNKTEAETKALKPLLALKSELAQLKTKTANKELEMKRIVRDATLANDKIKQKEEQIAKTLDRLKGLGSGISKLGQGIASLATPVTKEDPEVKNLATYVLETGEKRKEFTKLTEEFRELAKEQSGAVAELLAGQAKVDTCVANISENLAELNALSWQRHSMEGVLDIRVKCHLKDMENRAVDAVRWSIYTLVMAYRYEYLTDVSPEFYNFTEVVKRLGKLEEAPAAPTNLAAAPKKWIPTDPEKFKKTNQEVLRYELFRMALPILQNRQRIATLKENKWRCTLTAQQRSELRLRGRVKFHIVRDIETGSFGDAESRIVDIDELDLKLKSNRPGINLKSDLLAFR